MVTRTRAVTSIALTVLAFRLLLYQGVTTPRTPFVSRKKWPLVAVAGVLLGLAAGPAAAQGGARIDRSLRQRLSTLGPETLVNVIVTVKAGTKAAMCRVLVASGATITSEFSLIEAYGVRVSAGALQTLLGDARVVAVSSDGPVEAHADTHAAHGPEHADVAVPCPTAVTQTDVNPN